MLAVALQNKNAPNNVILSEAKDLVLAEGIARQVLSPSPHWYQE
jgi:hypothetical protein